MNNKTKSGLAIASLILGIISFIPMVGVLLGVIAIVLGIVGISRIKKHHFGGIKLARAGIILGALGICFSVILYGSLFYFAFGPRTGPLWGEMKMELTKQTLMQDSAMLELYKKQSGRYPQSLDEAREADFTIFGMDGYQRSFYYKVSEDGQSYELRSLGPDGVYGTEDDILPSIPPE